ncbi:MAG TPA: M50 family metallopeptidase, partial [Fimbriimonadaceae bacterium]|nr:M50 family metallopeptidase [Fimbriimonadaceae bacterium]
MFDPFYILVAVIFLTIVTVLVAAHELGHYLFARLFKMGVEEFAIGFGRRPLWTYMRRTYKTDHPTADGKGEETTNFTIRPWPLGGFVRIKGMVPEEDGSEVNVQGGFYSKPPWQRFVVLLAGPVFSILAGFALLIPLFMVVGVNKPLNEPVIGALGEKGESAAADAGLMKGDRILAIDGKPVSTFYDVILSIRDRGVEPVTLAIKRENRQFDVTLTPRLDEQPTPVLNSSLEATPDRKIQSKLGAGYQRVRVPQPFLSAVREAV